MKILRLTSSADRRPSPAPHERSPSLLKAMLEAATGDQIEVVWERAWPAPGYPRTLDRLLETHRPDLVTIWLSPFWYAYHSAPSRLEQVGGRAGRAVASVARSAAHQPWLANNRPFRAARRLALGTIGGAYLYEPPELAEAVAAWLRRIQQHEDVLALVYNTPQCWFFEEDQDRARQNEARRQVLNALLSPICRDLHALCDTRDMHQAEPIEGDGLAYVEADRMHPNVRGHAWLARDQFPALLAAWRKWRDMSVAPTARTAAQ